MKTMCIIILSYMFLLISPQAEQINSHESKVPQSVSNIEFNITHNQANTSPEISWSRSLSPNIESQLIRIFSDPAGKYPMSDWLSISKDADSFTYAKINSVDCLEHYVGMKVQDKSGRFSERVIPKHGFYVDTIRPNRVLILSLVGSATEFHSPTLTWEHGADNCVIKNYEVKITTADQKVTLLDWADIGNITVYQNSTSVFSKGTSYIMWVRAVDFVNNLGDASVSKSFEIK